MYAPLLQFPIATTEGHAEIVFELAKLRQLLMHIGQLFLESTPHWGARLKPVSAKLQQPTYFSELEAQSLHPAYERQRFQIAFGVLAKTA
jgi:hypothetical protein